MSLGQTIKETWHRTSGTFIKLFVLASIIAFVYAWRPLFHPIIYRMVYSPGGLILFGGTIAATIILFVLPPTEKGSSIEGKGMILGVVFVVCFIVAATYGLPAGLFEERTLAQQTMGQSESIENLPEVNADNPRIVPRAVADIQTRGSVSYRQHELGTSDIARMPDGRLAWSYAIQPEPFRVRLQGNQRGVLLSDMTSMEDREIAPYDNHEFVHGRAMFFHRSAEWNVLKSGFWSQYRDDPVEFVHDNKSYMAYPKTGHRWVMSPIPHTIPVWDGVALVHQDGTIEHLSPEEARQSEILDGQRLYPIYNAHRKAASLSYRNGITNQMGLIGTYEGVVEIADLPAGAGNSQPFVIDLEGEQMSYVMAMEPHGRDTRGLDEVWFFNADTGQATYYATGDETLFGPERAVGIVRSEDSRTTWGTQEGTTGFEVVEPIPVSIDNELWWHTKVVPTDQTDVTRNVFVNAHTGEAIELLSTQAVKDFMAGSDVDEIEDAGEVGETDSETRTPAFGEFTFEIVIRGEDGEVVDTISIGPGQTVSIEPVNSSGQ